MKLFTGMYVTTKGYEYLALARTGKILKYTKAEFGQGFLAENDSVMALTALKDKLGDLPLISKEANGDETIVTCQFSNANGAGGVLPTFWWSECGLYAQILNEDGTVYADEALYAYAYETSQVDADKIDGILQEFKFNIILKTTGASNIQIIVSSMANVSAEEFEAHKADSTSHLPAGGKIGQVPIMTADGIAWQEMKSAPDFNNPLCWAGYTRVTTPENTETGTTVEEWKDSATRTITKARRTTTENADGSYTEVYEFYSEDGKTLESKYTVLTTQDGEPETYYEKVTQEVIE